MTLKKAAILLFFSSLAVLVLTYCVREFKPKDHSAYFGGEVSNPSSRFVLFFKGNDLIDTLELDSDNRFFIKFDSLSPGLYTFRHEPEYQYVYFDKNDSLMVAINSRDFDESIVFSGRGDLKNNFLMELYLKNDLDRGNMFAVFDYDLSKFNATIDQTYKKHLQFYADKKAEIKWSEDFDVFAKAAVDFPYYSKKEIYPIIHRLRTGEDIVDRLPKNYYSYRKIIDFNNPQLSNYSPFVKYLSHMLNNVAAINYHNHLSGTDLALRTNTAKMNIADTLIRDEKIKNTILNNVAFTYLLEDQNIINNQKFLETYHKYSTDKSQENEITKIGNAIRQMKVGNTLPEVTFFDPEGNKVTSNSLLKKASVIFFWTDRSPSHFQEAHKKVMAFKAKYPNYNFIAVNVDNNHEDWKKALPTVIHSDIIEVRAANFEDLKAKWAITKIHRTIITDNDCRIKNAFASLFDVDFESKLK